KNKDLAALAVVGAIGDVQNAWGKLVGHNREIVKDATAAGVIEGSTDVMFYGRHSRPIFKALESFTDPPIPGVSNSPAGCLGLLKKLGIPLKTGSDWRRPADLSRLEKQKLASELITMAFTSVPAEFAQYIPGLIIGETYTLPKEKERSMLMDAEEFSTCMNSTARHEQPLLGFEVAKGNRGTYYRAMQNLIKYHRRCIAEGMDFIEDNGLRQGPKGYLQYFDGTGSIKETFIGTIANMLMGHKHCDPYKPVIGMVKADGVAKVSARCSKLLFLKGLDMAKAIRNAARAVGGEGGGHAVACGAQVKESASKEFIEKFEEQLVHQLSNA
ncbi:MAG: DHHA1 domain-containing protein, partial [Candidatus Hadarchaeota archaeon]